MSFSENSPISKILAEDIMDSNFASVQEDMTVVQAAHLMLRTKSRELPVLNANKDLVGIVTLTDLFILFDKALSKFKGLDNIDEVLFHERILSCKNIQVQELMSVNVFTIPPEMSLSEIISSVVKWQIHSFPVVKNNKVIGVLGRHQILNATLSYG